MKAALCSIITWSHENNNIDDHNGKLEVYKSKQ